MGTRSRASVVLVMLAAALLVPTAVFASSTKVKVIVEDLQEGMTRDCGITTNDLLAAASFPLQASGFTLVSDFESDFNVYVNVSAGEVRSGACAASVDVKFYFYSLVPNPWDSKTELREVEIFSNGSLLVWNAPEIASRIYGAVERYTKAGIVEMKQK